MRIRQISLLPRTNISQLLFLGRSINMAITTDQALNKVFSGANWVPTKIIALHKTGAFNTACAGGIYTAVSKGGNAIVASTQSWADLVASGTIVDATLAAIASTIAGSVSTLYLSLTTGNTGALTADVYVFGVVLG
jgi:hypothetical protein